MLKILKVTSIFLFYFVVLANVSFEYYPTHLLSFIMLLHTYAIMSFEERKNFYDNKTL